MNNTKNITERGEVLLHLKMNIAQRYSEVLHTLTKKMLTKEHYLTSEVVRGIAQHNTWSLVAVSGLPQCGLVTGLRDHP